jgi:hypothetical protein
VVNNTMLWCVVWRIRVRMTALWCVLVSIRIRSWGGVLWRIRVRMTACMQYPRKNVSIYAVDRSIWAAASLY